MRVSNHRLSHLVIWHRPGLKRSRCKKSLKNESIKAEHRERKKSAKYTRTMIIPVSFPVFQMFAKRVSFYIMCAKVYED